MEWMEIAVYRYSPVSVDLRYIEAIKVEFVQIDRKQVAALNSRILRIRPGKISPNFKGRMIAHEDLKGEWSEI